MCFSTLTSKKDTRPQHRLEVMEVVWNLGIMPLDILHTEIYKSLISNQSIKMELKLNCYDIVIIMAYTPNNDARGLKMSL